DGIRDRTVTGVQTCALPIYLVLDPGVDDVLGEDIALEEELVVALQLVERLLERPGHLRDVLQLLRREAVDVLVERVAGVDPVLEIGRASCRERGWTDVVTVS